MAARAQSKRSRTPILRAGAYRATRRPITMALLATAGLGCGEGRDGVEDLVGRSLGHGRYRLLSVIGHGGMATVYEAEHTGLHRRVAIKVLDPALTHRPDFVERFQREAETIAQLEHPHILPVYDTGEEGDLLYLVMFIVRGG